MSAPDPTAVEPAIVLRDLTELAPFSFRWPEGPEEFQTGWELTARVGRHEFRVRHGLGIRDTYGRSRVHAVTWLNGNVEVEGVEADDYAVTRSLISLLRRDDRKHVRRSAEVPDGYDAFEIVGHRREIDAPHSPRSLAVKIREDDLGRWAAHAWIRHEQRGRRPRPVRARTVPAAAEASSAPPPAPRPDAGSVVAALLAHGEALSARQRREGTVFTPDPAANTFVQTDPFAFLVAVISDQGIPAERAWAPPPSPRHRRGSPDPHPRQGSIQPSPHSRLPLSPRVERGRARKFLLRDGYEQGFDPEQHWIVKADDSMREHLTRVHLALSSSQGQLLPSEVSERPRPKFSRRLHIASLPRVPQHYRPTLCQMFEGCLQPQHLGAHFCHSFRGPEAFRA